MQLNLSYQETWLHKINPSLKFFLVVLLFVGILFIHDINYLINFFMGTILLYLFFTGHPGKRLVLIGIPFLLIFITSSTSMVFFGKGETTWLQWGLVHISEESFFRGIHLGFRGLVFAVLGVIFALTTRPVYLFYSLMQQLKLRPKYAYSFMAAVRLVPIIIGELQTLRYALKIRGIENEKGLAGFYKKLKAYAIPLLAQSIRRAHRIAVAMEAKRFTAGEKRTFYYQIGFSKYDIWFVCYFLVLILLSYAMTANFPYLPVGDVRYGSQ
ncbi:energy-coupling factor transporter transmembrane component T family protein [Sediminibacillus massiliensis]|uniref:energy-coupling factor transporter transmembrane component T family protein n=1 Tax=Sediminibacillus massiliensis TaxID=1926277 RepID=UPI00098884D7|nr:energy-coupling factor transporter transmembrane component T [Sediminibacillus massiliensis]